MFLLALPQYEFNNYFYAETAYNAAILLVAFLCALLLYIEKHARWMHHATKYGSPSSFIFRKNFVIRKKTPSKPLRSTLISKQLSMAEARFYAFRVSLNYDLNQIWRFVRLVKAFLLGQINTACLKDVYTFLMNTSCMSWLEKVDVLNKEAHIVFSDIIMPAGSNGIFGGTSCVHLTEVRFILDYSMKTVKKLIIQPTNTPEVIIDETQPCEIANIAAAIGALVAHPQVHLVGAEVANLCQESWKISHKAGAAANGMNYGALNYADKVIVRGELFPYLMNHNLNQGIPHPRADHYEFLQEHSKLFNMLLDAHRNPAVIKAANGDHIAISSIVNGSLIHGLDHYLFDMIIPMKMDILSLGGLNLTFLRSFAAAFNYDIVGNWNDPPDEVCKELKNILVKWAPEWEAGYQWAIVE